MTPWQKHRAKWKNCMQCPLHKTRSRIVLARGRVPCDVLFIGEAPGLSEDALGIPFCGPAGHLLNGVIDIALDGQYDYALTNLVACIPKEESGGGKLGDPPEASIIACAPRLVEFINLCRPKVVVRVGKLAEKYVESPRKGQVVSIVHPAAILRMDVGQQGLAIKRCIVTLEEASEGL